MKIDIDIHYLKYPRDYLLFSFFVKNENKISKNIQVYIPILKCINKIDFDSFMYLKHLKMTFNKAKQAKRLSLIQVNWLKNLVRQTT